MYNLAIKPDLALEILSYLKQYNDNDSCDHLYHCSMIRKYTDEWKTIPAILPSFPGKPINPKLAPSHLPDGAEQYAVEVLKKISSDIKDIYPPGINIKLFHDGYYFVSLGMDYDCFRIQEYVDCIKCMCEGSDVSSIDIADVTEGTTYEAKLNYWKHMYHISEREIEEACQKNPSLYDGMVIFFFNNYSKYLYPDSSHSFRRSIGKHVARDYIGVNMSVQKYIRDKYADHLRLSVKKQHDDKSKKLYIDILSGIEKHGLPWMNTMVEVNGEKIVKKFCDS